LVLAGLKKPPRLGPEKLRLAGDRARRGDWERREMERGDRVKRLPGIGTAGRGEGRLWRKSGNRPHWAKSPESAKIVRLEEVRVRIDSLIEGASGRSGAFLGLK
jgi:hypothetical protein